MSNLALEADLLSYRKEKYTVVYTRARRVVQAFMARVSGPVPVGWLGGDVSFWQASVDWAMAKVGTPPMPGWEFVYIRALFGMAVDEKFVIHWINSKIAGMRRGVYAYYIDVLDPEAQAQKLFDVVSATGNLGELPVVADIEEIANPTITPWKVKKYLEKLTALFGAGMVMVYTGKWVWDKWIGNVTWAKAYPLWLAQYTLVGWQENHLEKVRNYPPTPPKPWVMMSEDENEALAGKVAIWQFTSSCPAELYGVSGNTVDLDYSSKAFKKKFSPSPPAPPPPGGGGNGGEPLNKAKCLIAGLKIRSSPIAWADDRNKIGSLALNQEVLFVPDWTETPNATDEWLGLPNPVPGHKIGFVAKKHSTLNGPGMADLGPYTPPPQ